MRYKYLFLSLLLSLILIGIRINKGYSSNRHFAYGENIGWINFEPDDGPGIIMEGSYIKGYAWGENIGWINFSPSQGGVLIDNEGKLSGYAWGENVGWINFSCENENKCSYIDYGVSYNKSTCLFSGNAWGENIGWISFPDAPYQDILLPMHSGFNLFYFPSIHKRPFIAEDRKIIEKLYNAIPAQRNWGENSYGFMQSNNLNAIYTTGSGILYIDLKEIFYPIISFKGFIDSNATILETSDPDQCIDKSVFDLVEYFDPNGSTLEAMKDFRDIESITGQNSKDGKQEASYRFFGKICGKDVNLKCYTPLVQISRK